MAEVRISLAELDKIREDLNKAEKTIVKKDGIIKEKDAEIAKVLADKRTVLRTEKEIVIKRESSYDHNFDFSFRSTNQSVSDAAVEIFKQIRPVLSSVISNNEIIYMIETVLMRKSKEMSYRTARITADTQDKNEKVVTTEYINFEDVISELKEKSEKSVAAEMDSLKKTLHTLQESVTNNQINQSVAENRLIKKYEDEIKALKEAHYESYNKLSKDFENFRLEKDTRSLEQKVRDLEAEVNLWRNKKWYQSKRSITTTKVY